jgi:hypothetical protein
MVSSLPSQGVNYELASELISFKTLLVLNVHISCTLETSEIVLFCK